MGTISSGIGLISGIDYQSIIDKLMALEAKPRDQVTQRMSDIDAQSAAYLDISARITALLARIAVLSKPASFTSTKASSSLPDVLSATTGDSVRPGAYSFVVRALAATHQLVSRGFASASAFLTAGTVTIESAAARVNRATRLAELNGQAGVARGAFTLTDAAGKEAVINVADALTVSDVIDKINAAGIGVRASVQGDALVLTDSSGGTGMLRIREASGGHTAANLGFGPGRMADTDGDKQIVGSGVMYLAAGTALSALNDGLGVRCSEGRDDFTVQSGSGSFTVDLSGNVQGETRLAQLNHGDGVHLGRIRVTTHAGDVTEIDLSNATTVGDIKQALDGAFGGAHLNVVLSAGRLIVTDLTAKKEDTSDKVLKIEDVSGYAARDLGMGGSSTTDKITGRDILRVETVADVLAAINYAAGNGDASGSLVQAAVAPDGHGLVIQSQAGDPLTLVLPTGSTARALQDLGLQPGTYADGRAAGARLIGSLDSVLLKTLNGGAGLVGGTIRIAAGAGGADVDLTGAETLADVVARINAAAAGANLGIEAGYDANGTRLTVTNIDGSASPITIADVTGDFAATSGLAQTGGALRSGDLQRQYVNELTKLSDLNAGRGIGRGKLTITSSTGQIGTLDLSPNYIQTLGDVIEAINGLKIGVEARINETGDGLLIVNQSGRGTLKIEDVGATSARDLNIRGASQDGRIDGAYEFKLQVTGSDTVQTLAQRIGNETTLADASLLNDGTGVAPYRLSIAARVSGAAGELLIDDGGTNLGVTTLARPQDARVLFGGDANNGVLLASSDNTFDNVVSGLSITATAVDDRPVTVTVSQDFGAIPDALKGLVDDFNAAVDRIRQVGGYNAETKKAGVLLGEGTLNAVEDRLLRMFTRAVTGSGVYSRLSQLGLKLGSGAHLSFDETKLKAAQQADPEAVTRFFTDETTGVAVQIKKQLEAITGTAGLIRKRTDALGSQKELLQARVDQLNELLDRKRTRLVRQFLAMETALSQLQSQQAALGQLASSTSSYGLVRNSGTA